MLELSWRECQGTRCSRDLNLRSASSAAQCWAAFQTKEVVAATFVSIRQISIWRILCPSRLRICDQSLSVNYKYEILTSISPVLNLMCHGVLGFWGVWFRGSSWDILTKGTLLSASSFMGGLDSLTWRQIKIGWQIYKKIHWNEDKLTLITLNDW